MAKGKQVIYAGPVGDNNCRALTVEGVALGAAILPGTIVSQSATGLDTNTTAATVFGKQILVADKNQMMTRPVSEAWTQSANMVSIAPRSGEYLNMLVAATQDITSAGTALAKNGSGLLAIAATDGTEEIVCYADEVVDTTGGAATGTLVRVRF